jgi:hypothetical protein
LPTKKYSFPELLFTREIAGMALMWTATICFLFASVVEADQAHGASVHGLLRGDDEEKLLHLEPPGTLITPKHLPREFSWRDVPGVGSLLTVSGNQHIPRYCGACYAFGFVLFVHWSKCVPLASFFFFLIYMQFKPTPALQVANPKLFKI